MCAQRRMVAWSARLGDATVRSSPRRRTARTVTSWCWIKILRCCVREHSAQIPPADREILERAFRHSGQLQRKRRRILPGNGGSGPPTRTPEIPTFPTEDSSNLLVLVDPFLTGPNKINDLIPTVEQEVGGSQSTSCTNESMTHIR
jgi:hypothetical protein